MFMSLFRKKTENASPPEEKRPLEIATDVLEVKDTIYGNFHKHSLFL